VSSRVKDVMTGDVVTVGESAGYKDIIAVMRERRVSAVPVLDAAGHLAGVVSEADLLLKEAGADALGGYLISTGRRGERAKAAGVTAAGLMTAPPGDDRPGGQCRCGGQADARAAGQAAAGC
jgi:CBS domain-containing protein